MQIAHSTQDLRRMLAAPRRARRRIALVPTMGNLHAGHLALVERAKEAASCVVVSLFVNPLQFGPGEDFRRYPRTLEQDLRALKEAGVDIAYAPTVDDIYPNGYPPATLVQVSGPVTDSLEGSCRPGHFNGVATVVTILFNQVRPAVAVFGEKDWQQLAMIRRMSTDLGSGIEIIGAPIVRAGDGLALSSRNQYLSPSERAAAPRLQAALRAIGDALEDGRRDFVELCRVQTTQLAAAGFLPQYLEIRRPDLSLPEASSRDFVVLAAARLGKTRLIDNVHVCGRETPPARQGNGASQR